MSDARLTVTLSTDLGRLVVSALVLREELSVPTRGVCEVRAVDDPGFASLVDTVVTLDWEKSGLLVRKHTLKVERVRFLGVREGAMRFELHLAPRFAFLALSEGIRKFRDVSAKQIIEKVLGERRVPHRFELTRDPWSRPFTTQYRETDRAFVSRLLEFEGIHYRFDDEDLLVLSDRSSGAEPISPLPIPFQLGGGALVRDLDGITSFWRETRVGTGRATVSDYDWKNPDTSILASASGTRDQGLESYAFGVGYRNAEQGQTLAKLRVEAFECRKRVVHGESPLFAMRPGVAFSTLHEEAISLSGDWSLVVVEHRYEGAEGASPNRYSNSFEAIPLVTPFRPALVTPEPDVGGFHTATVRGPADEEIHTDVFGRAKVQFMWDREAKGTDEDSRWIRVLQEVSSSHVIARVGWEVAVSYIDGDPERPVAVGRLINGAMVATYAQPSNQNVMTIKSETYPGKEGANEIKLDDTSGAQLMEFTAEKTHTAEVKNDERETIARNETNEIGEAHKHEVKRDQDITIGTTDTILVGEHARTTVKSTHTERIGGNERVNVDEAVMITVGKTNSETVGSVRTSLVGGIKPPTLPKLSLPKLDPKAAIVGAIKGGQNPVAALKSQVSSAIPSVDSLKSALTPPSLDSLLSGSISRSAGTALTRTIGAARIAIARKGLRNDAGKLLVETVLGLRMKTSMKGGVMLDSGKNLVRMVGGLIAEKAGVKISHSSKESSTTIGGDADLGAEKVVQFRSGKEIVFEAKESLSFSMGGLKFELLPDKLSIVGKLRVKSGSSIHVGGSPDNVTK